MSKTARLKALRAFLKSSGYGRGFKYSAYPRYVNDPTEGLCENGSMEREQWSTAEIAAEAIAGEVWFIDVWAAIGREAGHVIDCLTFTFPAARCGSKARDLYPTQTYWR